MMNLVFFCLTYMITYKSNPTQSLYQPSFTARPRKHATDRNFQRMKNRAQRLNMNKLWMKVLYTFKIVSKGPDLQFMQPINKKKGALED